MLASLNESLDDSFNSSGSAELLAFFYEILNILEVVVLELCALGFVLINHMFKAGKVSGEGEFLRLSSFKSLSSFFNVSEVFEDVVHSHSSGNFSVEIKMNFVTFTGRYFSVQVVKGGISGVN